MHERMAPNTRLRKKSSAEKECSGKAVNMRAKKQRGPPSGSNDSDVVEASSSESSSDDEPVKTLAATRTRRANAGNRMEALTKDESLQDDAYKNIYGGFTETENDEEFGSADEDEDNSDSGESSISYEQTSSEEGDVDEARNVRVKDAGVDEEEGRRRPRKKFSELVAASNAKRVLANKKPTLNATNQNEPPFKRQRVISKSSTEVTAVKPVGRRGRLPAQNNNLDADTNLLGAAAAEVAAVEPTPQIEAGNTSYTEGDSAKLKEILLEAGDALRRSSRYATQQRTIETQERLFEERAARNARPKKVVHKDRPLTQEELLAMAADREKETLQWFEERRQQTLNKDKEQKKVRRKVKFQAQCVKFITRLRITDSDADEVSRTASSSGQLVTLVDDSNEAPTSHTESDRNSNKRSKRMQKRRDAAKNSHQAMPSTIQPTEAVIEVNFGLQSQYVFPSKQAMDNYFAPYTRVKYPEPKICPINGTTARYVDPLTKIPYSDKAALIAIRDQFFAHVRKNFPADYPDRINLEEWYPKWRAEHTRPPPTSGADAVSDAKHDV